VGGLDCLMALGKPYYLFAFYGAALLPMLLRFQYIS
jgi:hypothetical protein